MIVSCNDSQFPLLFDLDRALVLLADNADPGLSAVQNDLFSVLVIVFGRLGLRVLFMLDKGQFEKAEILLQESFEESKGDYEKIQITACYAELLFETERFDQAYEKAVYILENTDEYENDCERETAKNIIKKIDLERKNGSN